MTHDEARDLIAEGRKHDEEFDSPASTVEYGRASVWIRANLARLLDGYAEALAEVERLRPVVDASREMREAEHQLPGPPDTDVIAELEVYYANLKTQSVKAQANTARAILRWRSAVDQFIGTKP